MKETVAILGASRNPSRYARQAQRALLGAGHRVVLVNPHHDAIDGVPCVPNLRAVPGPIDTLTVYVRPAILRGLVQDIVAARPGRVILNPGTEDAVVVQTLRDAGIAVQADCTLVLLAMGRF